MKKLLFLAALFTATVMNLNAETVKNVKYIDANGNEQTCAQATVVENSDERVTWEDGWYVVTGTDVTLSQGAVCEGNVHLILADGAKLTAKGCSEDDNGQAGIFVEENEDVISLTIYGQQAQTGTLIAIGGDGEQSGGAGIGGNGNEDGAYITINGGIVTATGGASDECGGAGIGGGGSGKGLHITIYGGKVTATGAAGNNGCGAGIGGGGQGGCEHITISGGTITANGADSDGDAGAGIGGVGAEYIYINGGIITANGGYSDNSNNGVAIGCRDGQLTNIYVNPSLILKADNNNPPTTVIAPERTAETDIASLLAGKQYATVETPAEPDTRDYLHFVGLNGNDTIQLNKKALSNNGCSNLKATFEYSKDRKTWNNYMWGTYDISTKMAAGELIALNQGDTVFFRAKGTDGKNDRLSSGKTICFVFSFGVDDSIAAGGNIMSLYDASCEQTAIANNYGFYGLFENATQLVSAPKLPATSLMEYCYQSMFYGCTALTQTPELPADTLASYCYSNMFQNCTALTQAPALLPADTLAKECYSNMFQNCTALTQAPELKATTLASNCCKQMFKDCTALTQAPALPVDSLAASCYNAMFKGCTALTQAPELKATVLAASCYADMFNGCISLEVDTCLNDAECEGALLVVPTPSSVPSLWNYNMFLNCKGDAKYTAARSIQLGGHYCIKKYVPKEKITLAAEYGTYVSANTCKLAEGLEAYSCAEVNEYGVLQLVADSVLRENTPYILKGTEGTTYTCEVTSTGTYTEPVKVGILTGVYADTTAPEESFVLQNPVAGLGFYIVAAGQQPTVPANHCYLTLSKPSVKALYFDEETAIADVDADVDDNDNGKFFENGRVVIVKNNKKFNVAGQMIK